MMNAQQHNRGEEMAKLEFEFFSCTGKELFAPANEAARLQCQMMRFKNLTEKHLEFCIDQGHEVLLRPRVRIKKELMKYVVYNAN